MPTTYAIPDGRVAMAATLYNGTGAAQNINNTVNGVSFQPDLVWFKSRNITENHQLFDSVRGVQKSLYSNLTTQELTDPGVNTFNTNGFNSSNANGYTYVGWQWKGGGTPVSNTAGSITSSVSANPTAGFSVVTWTGTGSNATVGHGLGVAPSMVITKGRDAVPNNWGTWHTSLGALGYLYLNTTAAAGSLSTFWNSAVPTSSVFSLGSETTVNTSAKTYVAYCFAAVAGYSAFGSYTGNGSVDGPFVYLGFRPRYVLVKRTDVAADWQILDSGRSSYNLNNLDLYANLSNAEEVAGATVVDFTANGFKLRGTHPSGNASGGTYIYMAFAENPFKYANAR